MSWVLDVLTFVSRLWSALILLGIAALIWDSLRPAPPLDDNDAARRSGWTVNQ